MVAFCSSWNNTDAAVNICVIVGLQCLIRGSDQASLQRDERHRNADKQVVLLPSFQFIPEKRCRQQQRGQLRDGKSPSHRVVYGQEDTGGHGGTGRATGQESGFYF